MKLDFGAGYAPLKGWATLDIGYGNTFNSIDEIPDNSITKIRFRNVLHHIEDIEGLFIQLIPKFKKNIRIIVIECRESHFHINVLLDLFYYRVLNRTDMYIALKYRNYINTIENLGFNVLRCTKCEEKEVVVFTSRLTRSKYGSIL